MRVKKAMWFFWLAIGAAFATTILGRVAIDAVLEMRKEGTANNFTDYVPLFLLIWGASISVWLISIGSQALTRQKSLERSQHGE